MNKTILAFVITLLFTHSYSQVDNFDSLFIKNKVRTIHSSHWNTENKSHGFITIEFDIHGKVRTSNGVTYSKAGDKWTYVCSYQDGHKDKEVRHWTNKRKDINQITTTRYHYVLSKDTIVVIRATEDVTRTIKSDDNSGEVVHIPDTALHVLSYNPTTKCSTTIVYNGSFITTTQVTYDSLKRVVLSMEEIISDSFHLAEEERITYDDENKKYTFNHRQYWKEEIRYTSECTFQNSSQPIRCSHSSGAISVYTYLPNGLIREKVTRKHGVTLYRLKYSYDYY